MKAKQTLGKRHRRSPITSDYENSPNEQSVSSNKQQEKKLSFLSRLVLKAVKSKPLATGVDITNDIMEAYQTICQQTAFKNL